MATGRAFIFVTALSLLGFLGFLGRRDVVTSHEARVAQTSREMAQAGWPWAATHVAVPAAKLEQTEDGLRLKAQWNRPPMQVNPWGVPVLNNEIRLQKPPLPYWATAVLYRLFGVSEAMVRLWPALMGAAGALLMWGVARELIGRRAAWIAALAWVSSHFIVAEFRTATADPYLAFFSLLAIWAWLRWSKSASWPLAICFYAALGLGMMSKGPVILIHVAVPVILFHLLYRRPLPGGALRHLVGTAMLLAIVLPWPIYVVRNVPNAMDVWRYESLGELTGQNVEKARAALFYLPVLLEISLPWTAIWMLGWILPWINSRHPGHWSPWRRRLVLPVLWLAILVLFFSFSSVKKAAYLLPAMPAQALLVGHAAAIAVALARRRPWASWLLRAQAVIGIVLGLTVAGLMLVDLPDVPHGLSPGVLRVVIDAMKNPPPVDIMAAVLALMLGGWPLLSAGRDVRQWLARQAIAYTLLLLLLLGVHDARWNNGRSPRQFMAEVEAAMVQYDATLSSVRLQEVGAFYLTGHARYDPSAKRVLAIYAPERRKGRPGPDQSPDFFQGDVPGRKIISVQPVPTRSTAGRYMWRLFLLTVE